MLAALIGQVVVVDLRGTFVCLGTLHGFDDYHLELRNADFHDLRDTSSSRENYVAATSHDGHQAQPQARPDRPCRRGRHLALGRHCGRVTACSRGPVFQTGRLIPDLAL